MITNIIRSSIIEISNRTGRSIQEIVQEMVEGVRGAAVPFRKIMFCVFCGSDKTEIKSTVKDTLGTTRRHQCQFCTWRWRSFDPKPIEIEKKTIEKIEKPSKRIAKKKKKKQAYGKKN